MLRFLIRDVMLDQKQERGQVLIKIAWATGASSEHRLRRNVQAYDQYAGLADLQRRVRDLNAEYKMDAEIAAVLNREGYLSAHGAPFSGEVVHLLRNVGQFPRSRSTDAAQSGAMAGWKLFGSGDGRRARRNDADRLQISTKRPLEGSATEEEHAMANRRRGESHRGPEKPGQPQEPFEDRGIMTVSAREKSFPIRRRLIGGDQHRSPLVSRADQFEQNAGFRLILGDIGEVVEYQQMIFVELGDRRLEHEIAPRDL